jgi:hypothetical protein
MRLADELRAVVRHRFARQFSLLLAANAAVAVVPFFSNLLTYLYATNYLRLGMNAVTLGLPYSASRLLALERDRARQRRIIGATYALMVGLGDKLNRFLGASGHVKTAAHRRSRDGYCRRSERRGDVAGVGRHGRRDFPGRRQRGVPAIDGYTAWNAQY